jgi:hypothetical protein
MAFQRLLAIIFLMLSFGAAGVAHGDAALPDGRPVYLLAAGLREAPNEARSDFALAALSALIEVYEREAMQARTELRSGSRNRDLARWIRGVDAMIRDFQAMLDQLRPETPVRISTPDRHSVYLVVDGRPVLLSGPRTGEQGMLEQRVVDEFCARNYCNDLLDGAHIATAAPEIVLPATPLWRFSDLGGPVCASGDGLELQFRDATDLGRKRDMCTQLVTELRSMVETLRVGVAGGIHIEWSQLAVVPDLFTGQQRLLMTSAGDSMPLSAPYLELAPEFLRAVMPWVAARVDDRQYNLVVLNAGAKLSALAGAQTLPAD